MGPLALPPWLNWVSQLGTWFPPSPLSWAKLRLDGLILDNGPTAAAGSVQWPDLDDSWRYERRPRPRSAWQALIDQDIDFTQLVHEPTPGDLRLEERIREHLAPLLKPFEAVHCPPPYVAEPHLEQDPKWCKARQAVFDAADRLMALRNPVPEPLGYGYLKMWDGDPLTQRQRDASILDARNLRAQGKLWQSRSHYEKLNKTFGHSVDTFIEEMDALAETCWGTAPLKLCRNCKGEFEGSCLDEMEALALDILDPESLVHNDGSVSDLRLERAFTYRPPTEPPHSLFRGCLSWLVVLDYLLLLGPSVSADTERTAKCCNPAACRWMWQNSDRLEPALRVFLRRRVLLSFRRYHPRCSIRLQDVWTAFNLNLDAVQLVFQNQSKLRKLCLVVTDSEDLNNTYYRQVLDILLLLQDAPDARCSAAILRSLASFLHSIRSTKRTYEAESLIFAILLYDSVVTRSVHDRLRQVLWRWNQWIIGADGGVSDFTAHDPLVFQVLAQRQPYHDEQVSSYQNKPEGRDANSHELDGAPQGSSLSSRLNTQSIFSTTHRVPRERSAFIQLCWLWTLWNMEFGIQRTLLSVHCFEHHYLFSMRQHGLRIFSLNPQFWFESVGLGLLNGPWGWQDLRRSFAPGRRGCETPLHQARILVSDWKHFEALAKEIGTILQDNSAKPKSRRLPTGGMEMLHIVIHLFVIDTRIELADIVDWDDFDVDGEARIRWLTSARQDYLSLAAAIPAGLPLPAHEYSQTRALAVERRILRIGSLIGGAARLLNSSLGVEEVLRKGLNHCLRIGLGPPSVYKMISILQSSRSHLQFTTAFVAGCEAAIEAGDPVASLWWHQKGKAEVTAAFIAQRRTRAELVEWLQGDLDLESFRAMFKRSILERQPVQCGTAARRVVLLDWVEDAEYHTFHVAFARFGDTPIHASLQGVTPSFLQGWLERYWTARLSTLEHKDKYCALRQLDRLLDPLLPLASAEDVFVICPTRGLHAIPLHALHIEPGVPLLERYPVSYAYNFASYISSVDRSMVLINTAQTALREETVIAAVYRPIPGQRIPSTFHDVQRGLHADLSDVARSPSTCFLWDEQVTVNSFIDLLQTRRAIVFCGHCLPRFGLELEEERLLLADGHLRLQDLMKLKLPNSLLVLIACGSAAHSISPADEPLGLPTAALIAGAATVVGTMWPVRVEAAALFIQRFLTWLGHADMNTTHGMVDVARAVQQATLDVRQRYRKVADWAGYVLHGSPVMQDLQASQEAGPSSLVRR